MIHILSTSLASVSIVLSAVTLGIYLGARDVRIFDREKSLGQNNFGYNRSEGRNLSSASGQGESVYCSAFLQQNRPLVAVRTC